VLLVVLTRWPLAPKYLYYFDSVNFALALEEFNPALHRPQPPGYPLFVGVTRLLHLIFAAEKALVAAGLLASIAAILLLWRLGFEMFGSNGGLLAAALLLFNPAFWFGALTNQVRLYLAFCSVGLALLAWRALRTGSPGWLYAAFGALGIAAGFRPAMGVLMMPMLLWVWFRTGASPRRLMIGSCATVITVLPWVVAILAAMGGLHDWLNLMWQYVLEQFSGSSAAFGASAASAWMMAKKAIVWNGLGALAWLWVIPFSAAYFRGAKSREREMFVTLWFLPAFAFSAFIHIGDPDQALATIPALCLVGGVLIALFLRRFQSRGVIAISFAVAVANAALFFFPPKGIAVATSYREVAARDADNKSVLDTIRELKADGPVTIVHHGATVTWRHISYYFPEDYVIFAPPHPSEYPYTVLSNKVVSAGLSLDRYAPGRKIVLVTSILKREDLLASGWLPRGPLYYRLLKPGEDVAVGRYRVVPGGLTPRT
jgi:hypothetical protein